MDNKIKNLRGGKEAVWVIGSIFQFRALGLIQHMELEFNESGMNAYREIDDQRENLDRMMILDICGNIERFGIKCDEESKTILKFVIMAWKNEREEFLRRGFSELIKK